jgi:glycosyltransferase involved in cell wall biosynthesis
MKPGNKALYLSYDGLTDPLGQSQILPYLLGLEKLGWEFCVVSFEKPEAFKRLKGQVEESIANTKIHWIPLNYTKKPPVISTIFDLWRMKRKARQLDLNQFSVIHCRSYLAMLVGIQLKQHQRLIFDMRGFWADERVEGRLWPQNSWIYRLIYRYFLRKEKDFLQRADSIVSLTNEGLQALQERYDALFDQRKATVIPCCVDTLRFNILVPSVSKKDLGFSEDARIIIHVGSVGTWYRLDQELVFFKALKAVDSRWCFVILTQDIATAKSIVGNTDLSNDYIVVQSVNYREVPEYLNMAEASVQFIEPSFAKRASSPVKFAEALATGVPVIANEGIGDVAALLKEAQAGVVVKSWNDLEELAQQWDHNRFDRSAIRDYAVRNFGLEVGVQQYFNVYNATSHA